MPPLVPVKEDETQALLAPISDEAPAGKYLRYPLYRQVEEARRADDALPRGDWSLKRLKAADWPKVVSLTRDALAAETKDLQLAVWLTEALLKVRGFAGLRDGLRVVRGLHERFWDEMYPHIEEVELEGRARYIEWLSRQLAISVKEVPLTRRLAGDNYNYFQWQESLKPVVEEDAGEDDGDESKAAGGEAAPLRVNAEMWRKAKEATPREFYEQTSAVLAECSAELEALDAVLDEKFTEVKGDKAVNNSPGVKKLEKSLQEIGELVESILEEKPVAARKAPKGRAQAAPAANGSDGSNASSDAPTESDTTAPPDRRGAAGDGAGERSDGALRGREDALERLREVAAFFHETEPHSPVSYLVERAVRWGAMPLEDWLADVIGEEPALKKLRETLGLPQVESAGEGGGDDDGEEDDDD